MDLQLCNHTNRVKISSPLCTEHTWNSQSHEFTTPLSLSLFFQLDRSPIYRTIADNAHSDPPNHATIHPTDRPTHHCRWLSRDGWFGHRNHLNWSDGCAQVGAPLPTWHKWCVREAMQLLLVQKTQQSAHCGDERRGNDNTAINLGEEGRARDWLMCDQLIMMVAMAVGGGTAAHKHNNQPPVRIEDKSNKLVWWIGEQRPQTHNNQPNISDCINCKLCSYL